MRFEENWIDRVHLKKRVFPFNESIERGAGCLWKVEKDNRFRGAIGLSHGGAVLDGGLCGITPIPALGAIMILTARAVFTFRY